SFLQGFLRAGLLFLSYVFSSWNGRGWRVPYPLNSLHFVQGHLERSYGSGGFPQGPRLVSRLSVLWSSRAEGGWQDATTLGNAVLPDRGARCMHATHMAHGKAKNRQRVRKDCH
ncbi:mCG144647, partial [Mus musculus]